MDLTQVLQRSLSGIVFVIPGVICYFLILKKHGKKQTGIHILSAFVFCYYLIGIFTMTGIGEMKTFAPKFVFIPFVDMIAGPLDTALNVILFLPLGFFLSLLYKQYNRISKVAFVGFLLSLSVELVQMFGHGATDINDLITNIAGTCLGYGLYQLFSKLTQKELKEKFQTNHIKDHHELLFFVGYTLLIMITIQPIIIHTLFQLG